MTTPIPEVREVFAHTLQLCEYVLSVNRLADIGVVKDKAARVRGLIGALYGDDPVTPEDDVTDLL